MEKPKYAFYPPLKRVVTLGEFTVDVMALKLFEYVVLSVVLYDTNGKPFETRNIYLEGDDYAQWAADDQFIIRYVKNKLSADAMPM